jgi:hypothetical protein
MGHAGTAAFATRDLVVVNAGPIVVDVGRGPAAPTTRGLVVIPIGPLFSLALI